MANTDSRRGLVPVNFPKGGQETAQWPVTVGLNKIYTGDPVLKTAAGTVGIAGVTGAITGVVTGFEVKNADGRRESAAYYPGGSASDYYALVIEDVKQEYMIQEDSDGAALTEEDRGENINLIGVGTGNDYTGVSYAELDSSSVATTNTHQMRLRRAALNADNELGDNRKWIVTINNSTEVPGTGI